MKRAEYIPNMRYLAYWTLPNEFGDEQTSTNCDSVEEAKAIILSTGVEQGLIVFDKAQKFGYKKII